MGAFCHCQTFSILLIFFLPLSLVNADENVQGSCNKENSEADCQNAILDSGFIDESLNGLDQEDPVLIEAIKKLLLPIPSKGDYRVKCTFKCKQKLGQDLSTLATKDSSLFYYILRCQGWLNISVCETRVEIGITNSKK